MGRRPSLATIVRILLTPAFLNSREIASSIALPTLCKRISGSTDNAKTQPQGVEPNSQARISPMMNPGASAIRFVRAIFGNQEETLMQPPFAVTNEYIVPVFRLGELCYAGIKSDHMRDVGGLHAPDPHRGVGCHCERFCGCRQVSWPLILINDP